MMNRKNEEAVSPVIGVILMVAITVILAAVIAAFVFGMAGNVQKTKVVAATASQAGATTIYITYQGGQDQIQVARMNYTVGTTTGSLGKTVGDTAIYTEGSTGQDKVTVTAYFNDGSSQVILDTFV
jgi:flagellin-like protein